MSLLSLDKAQHFDSTLHFASLGPLSLAEMSYLLSKLKASLWVQAQALEAIKIASGVGKPLSRSLLLFDALAGRFTTVKLRNKVLCCPS